NVSLNFRAFPASSGSMNSLRHRDLARAAALCTLALLLGACASNKPAPVEDRVVQAPPPIVAPPPPPPAPSTPAPEPASRPQTYPVKRGDTLHQIALDQGLDYRDLAAWNNLENPNVIRVGQVLRLAAPGETATGGATTAPLRSAPATVDAKTGAETKPG